MKTKITLVNGSFYFLSKVNLMRGQQKEVDLDELNEAELNSLKTQVSQGCIVSDKDISDYEFKGGPSEAPSQEDPEPKEPREPELPKEVNITVVDEEDEKDEKSEEQEKDSNDEKSDNYDDWYKKDLKAELKKRGIETDKTRNEDLAELLKEDDKSNS